MKKGVQPDILIRETSLASEEINNIDKKVQELIKEKAQKKAA